MFHNKENIHYFNIHCVSKSALKLGYSILILYTFKETQERKRRYIKYKYSLELWPEEFTIMFTFKYYATLLFLILLYLKIYKL